MKRSDNDWEGFGEEVLEVTIIPRKNGKAICSGCHTAAPGYDTLGERRFEFIPFWGYRVFFLYVIRWVNCQHCGIRVEQLPESCLSRQRLPDKHIPSTLGLIKNLTNLI